MELAVRETLVARPGLLPVNEFAPRPVRGAEHHITLEAGTRPRWQPPMRLDHASRAEMRKILDEMLGGGIIERHNSAWGSPAFLVDRGGGKKRIVIDYRFINGRTKVEPTTMDVARDLFDSLDGARVFSTLDLKAGFFGVKMAEESRDLTTFTTHFGTFSFLRMPMGLTGAPSTYTRFIRKALGNRLYDHCGAYLDDLLCWSATAHEHAELLRDVLQRLDEAGATLSIDKCVWGAAEVSFLGHTVAADGLRKERRKVDFIKEMKYPANEKELASALAFMQFYAPFVQRFSERAHPIQRLLRKENAFVFGETERAAFDDLRGALVAEATLKYPSFGPGAEWVVCTDGAAGKGMGAVLCQRDEAGQLRPVCFASKSLRGSQANWSAVEVEAGAVVWAVKTFEPYLAGRRFKVVVDHKALQWLFTNVNACRSGKLQRWVLALRSFTFSVHYRPGVENEADLLSRAQLAADYDDGRDFDTFVADMMPLEAFDVAAAVTVDVAPLGADELLEGEAEPVVDGEGGEPPAAVEVVAEPVEAELSVEDRLRRCHAETHAGRDRMIATVAAAAHRDLTATEKKRAAELARECRACAVAKPGGAFVAPVMLSVETPMPGHTLSCDFTHIAVVDREPLLAFTATDVFSGMVAAYLVENETARSATEALTDLWHWWGRPRFVLTDNAQALIGDEMAALLARHGVGRKRINARRPQGNPIERKHRDIKETMRALLHTNPDMDVAVALDDAVFAHNTTVSSATGDSPFGLFFGRNERGDQGEPADARRQRAAEARRQGRDRRNERHNRAVGGRAARQPAVGDFVFYRNHDQRTHQMMVYWLGPFEVVQAPSAVNVVLRDEDDFVKRVHVTDCKPFAGQRRGTEDRLPLAVPARAAQRRALLEREIQPMREPEPVIDPAGDFQPEWGAADADEDEVPLGMVAGDAEVSEDDSVSDDDGAATQDLSPRRLRARPDDGLGAVERATLVLYGEEEVALASTSDSDSETSDGLDSNDESGSSGGQYDGT